MTRKLFFILGTVSLLSLLCAGCEKKLQVSYSQVNDEYVESISGTGLGRLSPVVISFTRESKVPLETGLYLSPSVKGEWKISEDNRTAVFTPAEPYRQNSILSLKADCKKLFGASGPEKYFERQFIIENPSYSVNFDEIRLDEGSGSYCVSGNAVTDIPVTEEKIASTLNAKLSGKTQKIQWSKSSVPERWDFVVSNIPVSEKDRNLKITWSGKSLGMDSSLNRLYSGSKTVKIPGQGSFEILDINTAKSNTILVSFSQALDTAQDVASFIIPKDKDGYRAAGKFNANIRGNLLTIFSDSNFDGVETVSIDRGILSASGGYLVASSSVRLADNWELPEVKFSSENVILPTTKGAVYPIETKNLSGVIVQVYEIYDKNMIQFLQDNELDGTYNINRVGEPVWEKKINFIWNDSMQNKFVARGLDLSEITKKYSNGMFHIRISFRKDQVRYVCSNSHQDFRNIPQPPDSIEPYITETEKSSWDWWDDVKSEDRNTFWRYRKDPCHPAYYSASYNYDCLVSRNILVSDVGIIAKRDVNNCLYVTVTDIRTAKPVPGADVTLKSYVGTTIASGKTDSKGTVIFPDSTKSYVIVASANRQTSYLKISYGTSLSTSHFETGGELAENGVKGFIYGERGVWRPGDNIFLTFVLQDLAKSLPSNIPVSFELTDPLGRTADTQLLTNKVNGFYPIETSTKASDVTGLWTAKVKIGGKSWSKYLNIETVVPNKLSVELESSEKILTSSSNSFTLTSAWLHGAPTPGYKAEVSVAYAEAATIFDGYSDYSFTNPEIKLQSDREIIWEGKLNNSSKADFNLKLDAGNELPGKLKANFITKVFEPAGGFSSQSKSFVYSPYDRYVGVRLPKGDAARNMLLTDVDHTADVVLLDPEGKPVSSANLSWEMYKLEWKWWWEKDAYTDAAYVSSYYRGKIDSGNVSVSNGRGNFTFKIKYPDWGRYMIVVKDSWGHSAAKIVYIDWPGWAGRAQEDSSGSAAMVPLSTDKKQYKTGETAEISFASGIGARALVTVEKSGTIIKQDWIETESGTTVYKLNLTSDMAPNVYVHVTLLQQHLQTANSLPIRLYGVVPVNVENPATKLSPVITASSVFEPNASARISVSEASGKPMTYTLAVVDEGLLGLTNYHSPDLRSEFYKKEASQLENWDIYKYVVNAYSGKLETLLSIGGSEDFMNGNERNENRFAPVVKYFGPFTLAAGEKKVTVFDMPNYVGAVRAMVIAGNEGSYGTVEKSIPVKSDLMVQTSIPRTLGAEETVLIPVSVFNCMEKTQTVNVTLSARGVINLNKVQSVEIPAGDSKVITFQVETSEIGKANFIATAKTGSASSKSSCEVDVMSRGVPVSYRSEFVVKPGKSAEVSVKTPTEKKSTSLTAEVSLLPQLNLSDRLDYLVKYPHGCIEQITSGGFPQLYLPGFEKLSPDKVNSVKDNVISVFERYPSYQTSSGGMAYWPGQSVPHEWGTCYAVHFMLEAKKKGYSVPDSILTPALNYISGAAVNWNPSQYEGASVQAYRLFVLALAGKPELGAMNRLYPDAGEDSEARLLLAASYALAGRTATARDILKLYRAPIGFFRNMGSDFSSDIRQQAVYMTASWYAENTADCGKIAKLIVKTLSSDQWLSTQDTAWSLAALMPYYIGQKSGEASYELSSNGKLITGKLSETTAIESLRPDYAAVNQMVTVKNTGNTMIYGTVVSRGMSVPGTEKERKSDIALEVKGLGNFYKPGDTVKFMVTVKNNSRNKVENVALTVPASTCFEFTNDRLTSGDERMVASSYTYQDIKDEGIYTYFDLEAGKSKSFTFMANVAYTGNFFIPAIHAEAMYDDSVSAMIPGRFVQMIK